MNSYEQIRQAIRGCGISRRQISLKTKLSEALLCLFMQGERGLSFKKFEELADKLDLEIIIRPRRQRRGRKSNG